MLKKIYLILAVVSLPIISFAQDLGRTRDLLESADDIVREVLIPLAFSLALLYFFWGVAKYIRTAGDKEEGKKIMIWGIVGLAVITLVWGLVAFVAGELGLDEEVTVQIPTISK